MESGSAIVWIGVVFTSAEISIRHSRQRIEKSMSVNHRLFVSFQYVEHLWSLC
jgi:hypothetical protein